MRSLLLAALLLAPLAQGHAGVHAGEEAHAADEGGLQPGAWPPPNGTAADQTQAPRSTAPASALPPVAFDPTVASPATRDWYAFKGDPGRTGANGAKAPLMPERRWDAAGTVGVGIFAPPVVGHGLVVFAGLDRKVHAVDGASGFKQWEQPLPAMVYASPTIAEDKVLVQAVNGTLLAFDLRNGTERWRAELGEKTSASPLVVNGVAYTVTEPGTVYALDIGDGKTRWNRTLAPVQSTVAPLFVSGRLIVGDARGFVHGLHALTGQTLWTASVGAPVTATPVAAGKQVVVPTFGLRGLEVESGRVLWTKALAGFVRSSPAYQAGVLVFGDPEGPGIVGANALNGERLWRVPTRLFVRSAPTIAQDVAVVAADDGSLFALRLRNGTVLWTLDAGERMRASPVVLDGKVFAARMDGVLRLFADPEVETAVAEAGAGPSRNGLLELLPVFLVLALPYAGLKVLRERMRRAALEPAPPLDAFEPPATARDAAEQAARRGFVRATCPRCACHFGVAPRHHAVVQCPGCGLRSEVRRKRAAERPPAL